MKITDITISINDEDVMLKFIRPEKIEDILNDKKTLLSDFIKDLLSELSKLEERNV